MNINYPCRTFMPPYKHIRTTVIAVCVLWAWLIAITSCKSNTNTGNGTGQEAISLPDTLHVGTLYSPMSYFIYREEQMGYDYDLVQRFGSDKGITIDLHVAPSMASLIQMLDSGIIDIRNSNNLGISRPCIACRTRKHHITSACAAQTK